ncbi:MAG TPA: hypothetical protein VHZ24_11040 [Pirellulales bacterium]|nr:hypothetical protein [Pirellulales bacterium]
MATGALRSDGLEENCLGRSTEAQAAESFKVDVPEAICNRPATLLAVACRDFQKHETARDQSWLGPKNSPSLFFGS